MSIMLVDWLKKRDLLYVMGTHVRASAMGMEHQGHSSPILRSRNHLNRILPEQAGPIRVITLTGEKSAPGLPCLWSCQDLNPGPPHIKQFTLPIDQVANPGADSNQFLQLYIPQVVERCLANFF
jgi:hypothetical protein